MPASAWRNPACASSWRGLRGRAGDLRGAAPAVQVSDLEVRHGGGADVIRARVRAWLLGIRLLTLEAWITAGSDGAPVPGMPSVGRGTPLPGRVIRTASAPDPVRLPAVGVPGTSVARARELVEQGARVLDQERRRLLGRGAGEPALGEPGWLAVSSPLRWARGR